MGRCMSGREGGRIRRSFVREALLWDFVSIGWGMLRRYVYVYAVYGGRRWADEA